ncbi:hypothetical protein BBP40_004422 [Aspergillus hancockii]|nr:hypothetical protein BBP40_004422 [Aspergillus hancockii]
MSPPVLDRVRSVIHKAKLSASRRKRSSLSRKQQPAWQRLPGTVLARILAQCGLQDIYSLMRSCRILRQQIYQHEYAISQAYLHRRTRPYQYITETEHELVPGAGDDLTFISSLFPPPPPQYTSDGNGLPEYSFGYLADLTRCWKTCIKLSYYLAEYMVHHHIQTDPIAQSLWSSSKTEKEYIYTKGVGQLQSRLLSPLANIIFFLESHASASVLPPSTHQQNSLKTQQSILQQPPFTDTQTLLSTHHTMHLLCTSVRHLMAPEISPTSAENWLSLLLTTSTLERIMEFFVAVAADEAAKVSVAAAGHFRHHAASPPSTWTNRLEFMWQMRRDWDEFLGNVEEGECGPPALSEVGGSFEV